MKYSLSPIDFKYVYNNSKALLIKEVMCYYMHDENPRLGFIVSRKYGNAVERNLFKRRCRHAFYELIKTDFTYSIIIKPKSKNIKWNTIKKSFEMIHENIA